MWPQVLSLRGIPLLSFYFVGIISVDLPTLEGVCWNFGVRLTWHVNATFGNGFILVYIVAIFVVIPHSFVTLHHHELVRPHLGCDFPHVLFRSGELQTLQCTYRKEFRSEEDNVGIVIGASAMVGSAGECIRLTH